MDTYQGVPIIDDGTPNDLLFAEEFGRGAVPRDYAEQPVEMLAHPDVIPVIPRSEWEDRIKELDREEATLDHVLLRARKRGRWADLIQGSWNFCWGHSVAHAVQLAREVANQPFVPLSAFGLVHLASAKRAQSNDGGWCGLSAQAAREHGVPSQAVYPQGQVSRQVTDEIRQDAANHIVTEDFVDIALPVWSQKLKFDALISCLLTGRPCAVDFAWWGHSVIALRPVITERGSIDVMILNSWPGWGDQGRAILRGERAKPDGSIAINTVRKLAA
jgi:hypothetical protein